jgi:hypothetical protein
MKTNHGHKFLAALAGAGLTMSATMALAQDISTDTSTPIVLQPPAINPPAPQLAYGVPQILQLTQAKVGDDTIVSYIKNSGNSYGLNADQIIYLKQQGVSDAVITTMLNQPKPGVIADPPPTPATQPVAATVVTPPTTTTLAPNVTYYVQTVPATTYNYYQPYYQPYNYPYYALYPPVSVSFAWRNGWHGGGYYGGWHGGYYGGWHGGGWHH